MGRMNNEGYENKTKGKIMSNGFNPGQIKKGFNSLQKTFDSAGEEGHGHSAEVHLRNRQFCGRGEDPAIGRLRLLIFTSLIQVNRP
jgi:hypothetical protein